MTPNPNTTAPITDAELTALETEVLGQFPRVLVAKGKEVGTVADWLVFTMARFKNSEEMGEAISKGWNALPGLLARLRAAEAKVAELEASRFQPEGGHPLEDEASLESEAHWQTLTPVKDDEEGSPSHV